MFCNKNNVNILTSLLVAFGVRHAVVCPGSRNAPIVHNMNECPDISCHAVTDERSAGFYALGIALQTQQPVVVCVTSGSALLGVMPAVAEAYYQHVPLVVVSADRPQQWIGQQDGQTLPQPGVLAPFVAKSVSLPEVVDNDVQLWWYCNRLVNEALLSASDGLSLPVHINVPISEPLFGFDTQQLPTERQIVMARPTSDYDVLHQELVDGLFAAERPMIVFGQTRDHSFEGIGVDNLFSHVIVLHESLSPFPNVSHFDEVLYSHPSFPTPDFIIFLGGTVVSKRLRQFLRSAVGAQSWYVGPQTSVTDTWMNLRGMVVGDAEFVLQALNQRMAFKRIPGSNYRRQWLRELVVAAHHAERYEPPFSQMAAVRIFEQQITMFSPLPKVHYANSTAIRLANIYAHHYVYCNRGVNGIEGSLSTAAGFSLTTSEKVFCVTGDLSFFYDQNALWNQNLHGNLRILLLNNGGGGIFNLLSGLEQSAARDSFVAAHHSVTAQGICMQNEVDYRQATDMRQLIDGIAWLVHEESEHPLLLEVLTDVSADEAAFRQYYSLLRTLA